MNKKQLIVTSVLIISMLVLAVSQNLFFKNFERINTIDNKANEFKEYKFNDQECFISLPNEWSEKEKNLTGYVSYELIFNDPENKINGIVQFINTKEDIKVFADRDIKNQSLKYSDLKSIPISKNNRSGILCEYNTSIRGGNNYRNKSYYLALNDNQIIKLLFNIKNNGFNNNTDILLEQIVSSFKEAK